jgi:uncharacterized membrane protein YhaH (DUF805 family)
MHRTFSRINFAVVTSAAALAFGATIMTVWNQAFSAAAEIGRINFWQAMLILVAAFIWMQAERFLIHIGINK